VALGSEALLRIKVVTDATSAAAGLDKQAASAGRFSSAMRKAALPAAAVVAGLAAIGKSAVNSASDLQQAEGAVEAVFGRQADAVKKAAQSADTTMGLSAAQYENYAALVGTALQNAGLSVRDSVTESGKVMQRGADLSALYGGTTADAVEAINAAVSRSEFDPLEKYGVSLNMTAVNAELAAKGQDKLTGKQLDAAKKAIILEQVYRKSAKAAGQYAREADSVAGRQQTMTAQWENASAALGQVLLPVVAKAAAELAKFGEWAQKNATTVQILAGVVGALAVAVLAANAAITTATVVSTVWGAALAFAEKRALGTRIQLAALKVATLAQAAAEKLAAIASNVWAVASKVLAVSMYGIPVFWLVGAILLLVGAFVLAYKRSETFRRIVDAAFAGVVKAAKVAGKFLGTVFGAVFKAIGSAAKVVGKVISAAFKVAFALASAYVRAYVAVIRAVLSVARAIVSTVASFVKDKFGDAWRVVSQVARAQIAVIRQAVDGIRAVIATVASALRAGWTAAWNAAKAVAVGALNAIKGPVDAVRSVIDRLVSAVQNLISWISRIKFPSPPSFLSKLGGKIPGNPFAAAAAVPGVAGRTAAYVPAPAVRGLGVVPRAAAGGGGITINVTGALDPEGTARAIKRVLEGHTRRVGLRTA
jgi:hypothetical protein